MIVITPLITIMDEQTRKLEGLGFRATYLGLDLSQNELMKIVSLISCLAVQNHF